jgi:hypothetical protein
MDLTAESLDYRSAAANQINQQHHQGYHEEQVNKSAQRVTRNDPHQPQDQKNYEDCPKHVCASLVPVIPRGLPAQEHHSSPRSVRGLLNRNARAN